MEKTNIIIQGWQSVQLLDKGWVFLGSVSDWKSLLDIEGAGQRIRVRLKESIGHGRSRPANSCSIERVYWTWKEQASEFVFDWKSPLDIEGTVPQIFAQQKKLSDMSRPFPAFMSDRRT